MKKLSLLLGLATASPALANDTTAELRPGGLVFVRSDVIAMEKEDLFISPDKVRVAYVFRNQSDADVDTVVAFPMPDIQADPYSNVAIPVTDSDNFLGFTVEVEGASIMPALEQKAFAAELDVTAALTASGIALNPYADGVYDAVQRLPDAIRADWTARGILLIETYDDGSGMRDYHAPSWRLKSTYWWRMTFPAGQPIDVRHAYKPSVGGTVGVTFLFEGKPNEPYFSEHRARYCMEDGFVNAVRRAGDQGADGFPPYYENWISYVLTTGANWAGPIGEFRLTIDKGAPENLVSFCGTGVRKVGPTTFEMTASDFSPERDVEILLLRRFDPGDGGDEPAADTGEERPRISLP